MFSPNDKGLVGRECSFCMKGADITVSNRQRIFDLEKSVKRLLGGKKMPSKKQNLFFFIHKPLATAKNQ